MNLPAAFDAFYDEISLGKKQVDKIDSAARGLTDYLTKAYDLRPSRVFLQGSYPNQTAIAPADSANGEYDVDLVCICAAADASADAALDDLHRTLSQHGTYAPLLKREGSRKKPCVRLRYAGDEVGDFHVDIVPARASSSFDVQAPLEVPRRGEGWHDTAPAEYTQWCRDQGERFARTVMMLKRWREVHQPARQSIKSIVLQVLTADSLGGQASDGEALAATLRAIHSSLALSPDQAPRVGNPVLRAENLAGSWQPQAYRNFRAELDEAVKLADRALQSHDEADSHNLWRKLLGDDFPPAPSDPAKRARTPPAVPPPGFRKTPQPPPRRERYGI